MRTFFYLMSAVNICASFMISFRRPTGFSAARNLERYFLIISFILIGIIFLIAGIKKYRGGWSTTIGVFCLFVGISGLGMELNKFLNKPDYDWTFGITVVAVFITGAILLLFSGHKLHKQTLELESLRKESDDEAS